MEILLSNDDGFRAPGIKMLADALRTLGRVTVIAPDRDRSGASNSLTLDNPLRVRREDTDVFSVNGTPTDCVHLGITGLLEREPDMVVSGINAGANLGDDVIYSGTVAAAMEGRFLGLPAIAVSLASGSPGAFAPAALLTTRLLQRLASHPLPADTILNVNVPALSDADGVEWKVTRLGHRHRSEPMIRSEDPRGRPVYWVGAVGGAQDAGPGTDFHALSEGCVSVTPLQVDLTRHDAIGSIGGWLEGV